MNRASTAPMIATTALTQNAVTYADSAGIVVWPIVSALTIAAPTCPPITEPIVRMTVFMPVATPVSDGLTASTISFAIAANANGTPIPMNTMPSEISIGCAWKSASTAIQAGRDAVSGGERSTAPQGSSLDGVLTGDSGTKRHTPSVAIATTIAPTMNSQRHDPYSTSAPDSTRPSPPPTPSTAETSPT